MDGENETNEIKRAYGNDIYNIMVYINIIFEKIFNKNIFQLFF